MNSFRSLMTVATVLAVIGCGRHGSDFLGAAEPVDVVHPLLISAGGAQALADDDSVVFIDGRKQSVYRNGHIPGAVNLSWESSDLYDMPVTGNDVDLAAFRTILAGTYGIDNSRFYIVYGGTAADWGAEGRVAWLFDLAGVTRYRVLHGGYGAWTAAGYAAGTAVTTLTSAAAPVWGAVIGNYASTTDIQTAFPDTLIQFVDTRAYEEWSGDFNYNSLFVTKGHIPGAVHADFSDLYQAAAPGYLRSPGEIASIFIEAGIDTALPVITYCTGGVRSAFSYFAFRLVCGAAVWNYDLSYGEWGLKLAGRATARVVADTAGLTVLNVRFSYGTFMADPGTYLAGAGITDTGDVVCVVAATAAQERNAVRQLAALGYRKLRIKR